MTLKEIKDAVEAGKIVQCGNDSYRVIKDGKGQWMIKCDNGHCIGLTWSDETTLNAKPEDFYIREIYLKIKGGGSGTKENVIKDLKAIIEELETMRDEDIEHGGEIEYENVIISYDEASKEEASIE